MTKIVVRVHSAVSIPAKARVAAYVEVLQGQPLTGHRLVDVQRSTTWEITGLGHFPPPIDPSVHLDHILLRCVEGDSPLVDGTVLEELHQGD